MAGPEAWLTNLGALRDVTEAHRRELDTSALAAYAIVLARQTIGTGELTDDRPPLLAVAGYNAHPTLRRYLVAATVNPSRGSLRYEVHSFIPDSEDQGDNEASCGVAEGDLVMDDGLHFVGVRASGMLRGAGTLATQLAEGVSYFETIDFGSAISGGREQATLARVMVESRGHILSDQPTTAALQHNLDVARSVYLHDYA